MKFTTTLRLGSAALILPAAILASAVFAAEPQSANSQTATPQTISLWVSQLGSDSYTVREGASDNLIEAGRSAIDATVAATQKDDLEVTTRAVQILARC